MGEMLTRLTIWLAVCAYAAGAAMMLLRRGPARAVWALGCAFFLAHVACAFGFFHGWSHAAAYDDTARQTVETAGLQWGGGIFFNYLFALAWLADVLTWHRARRPRWLSVLLHSFLFFMVVSGAFVFVRGPMRWFGLTLCVALAMLWVAVRARRL